MTITEYSPQNLSQIQSEWKELEKGTEMTCFQTYDWYDMLNGHFLAEKKKAPFRKGTYVLLRDTQNHPLLIAPIQIVKTGFYFKNIGLRKGFYFIGRQGYSDYLNFIYKELKPEYLQTLFAYLQKTYGLNFFCFENVPSVSASHKILSNNFNTDRVDSLCMTLPLQEDFEAYKMSLSKNMRQNIRTAFNRSAKDNINLRYEIIENLDAQTASRLMEIRAQRLQKKKDETMASLSLPAKVYTRCRDLLIHWTSDPIHIMTEAKHGWCFLARCNDEIGAFFYCLYKPENKTVYLILAGVDKKYEWYSPGITQLFTYIQDEINAGKPHTAVLDMTRGNEKYKYDLKSEELVTSGFSFNL